MPQVDVSPLHVGAAVAEVGPIGIRTLPRELMVLIVGWLPLQSVLQCRLVCVEWARSIDAAHSLWRRLLSGAFQTTATVGCADSGGTCKEAFLQQCRLNAAWGTADCWQLARFERGWGELDSAAAADPQAYRALFGPQAAVLLTAHGDGSVQMHDVAAGAGQLPPERRRTTSGSQGEEGSAVVSLTTPHSLDAGHAEVWTGAMDGSICFWDLRDQTRIGRLANTHTGAVVCMHSADGVVISGSLSGETRLWTGPSLDESTLFAVHTAMVVTVRITARKASKKAPWFAASGGNDHAIAVYEVHAQACVAYISDAHNDCVGTIEAILGSSTSILTGGDDGWVTLWDFSSLSVSAGQQDLVAEQADLLKLATGSLHPHWVTGLRHISQPSTSHYCGARRQSRLPGDWILSSGGDGSIRISSMRLEPLQVLDDLHNGIVSGLHLARGGRFLVSSSEYDSDGVANIDNVSEVFVWNLNTGRRVVALQGGCGRVTSTATSDTGAIFAATPEKLLLWRLQST
jgi:WD40 repeat protein